MLTLGIDIGGTSVKAAMVRDGGLFAVGRGPAYRRPDLTELAAAIHAAAASAIGTREPDAIGLCLPGAWDESLRMVTKCVNVPSLVGIPAPELLRLARVVCSRVTCCTDAFAAAYDVFESGGLTGRLLAVSLGTGVGGAVLDDGVQLIVSGRSSGHLGQLDCTVEDDGKPPPIAPDGGRGGLEGYIGLPALLARYGGDARDVFARMKITDAPLRALVRGLRIAHAIYRPHHVRLLGGVGIRLGAHVPALHAAVSDGLTSLARPDWSLACGSSDHHAAVGAARLAARAV